MSAPVASGERTMNARRLLGHVPGGERRGQGGLRSRLRKCPDHHADLSGCGCICVAGYANPAGEEGWIRRRVTRRVQRSPRQNTLPSGSSKTMKDMSGSSSDPSE